MPDNMTSPPPANPVSSNFFTSKPFIILVLTALVLCGGIMFFQSLADKTALSFSFTLDGKSLTADNVPDVKVDGLPFTSGNKIKVGRHALTVQLQDAEPLAEHFWVFFGAKNLGVLPLETSKGSLVVSVNPSPATVVVQKAGQIVSQGASPLSLDKLPVGNYTLILKRGEYQETRTASIQRQKQTETKVDLNLGSAVLSAEPADAAFDLSGNGHHWQGSLPTNILDVPVGDYLLLSRRKGWELKAAVSVVQGKAVTNITEFQYGSIELTSEPAGLVVSTNGVAIGKTPVVLGEIRPGQYSIAASDGDNDLIADISVPPKVAVKHTYVLKYGSVQLSSMPSGATVIRKGKEIGKTPLALTRIPAGETRVELRLQDYVSTNLSINTVEGVTTQLAARLISERYLQAMKQAREAYGEGQYDQAQTFVAAALSNQPDDSDAKQLRDDIAKTVVEIEKAKAEAAEAARVEQANAVAQRIASLPWLNFKLLVADCTDTRQVQRPVQVEVKQLQMVRDSNGNLKAQWVKTGTETKMETESVSEFNDNTFTQKYKGKTFRFNCPDKWSVSKVDTDGTVIFKGERSGSMGLSFHTISASPPANNREVFRNLQKGQKIIIKGEIAKYTSGFIGPTLSLDNAEIIDQNDNSRVTTPNSNSETTTYITHEYDQNGFCVRCKFSKAYIEQENLKCKKVE